MALAMPRRLMVVGGSAGKVSVGNDKKAYQNFTYQPFRFRGHGVEKYDYFHYFSLDMGLCSP